MYRGLAARWDQEVVHVYKVHRRGETQHPMCKGPPHRRDPAFHVYGFHRIVETRQTVHVYVVHRKVGLGSHV